jgi:hypothetical protein
MSYPICSDACVLTLLFCADACVLALLFRADASVRRSVSVVADLLILDTTTVPPIHRINKGVFDGVLRKKVGRSKEKDCDGA